MVGCVVSGVYGVPDDGREDCVKLVIMDPVYMVTHIEDCNHFTTKQ